MTNSFSERILGLPTSFASIDLHAVMFGSEKKKAAVEFDWRRGYSISRFLGPFNFRTKSCKSSQLVQSLHFNVTISLGHSEASFDAT